MITTEMISEDISLFNCWQFGDWKSLAHINPKVAREQEFVLKACAQMQLGELQQAKNNLELFPAPVTDLTKRLMVSGLINTLGKAREIVGDIQGAELHFANAIKTVLSESACANVIKARTLTQVEDVNKIKYKLAPVAKINIPYVDVIGPSGSGKTTLIKHLIEHHGFTLSGSLAKANNELDGKLILDFLKHYPLFLENIQHILDSSDLTSDWFSKLITGYMKSEGKNINLITDEGFVCRLNTIFSYQKKQLDQNEINRYLDSIPQPQVLVIIKAMPDLIFERMNSRPSGLPKRMRSLYSDQQRTVIDNQIKILDWVEEYYQNRTCKVIVTDSKCNMDILAKKIIELTKY